jgi:hypothetical protein
MRALISTLDEPSRLLLVAAADRERAHLPMFPTYLTDVWVLGHKACVVVPILTTYHYNVGTTPDECVSIPRVSAVQFSVEKRPYQTNTSIISVPFADRKLQGQVTKESHWIGRFCRDLECGNLQRVVEKRVVA